MRPLPTSGSLVRIVLLLALAALLAFFVPGAAVASKIDTVSLAPLVTFFGILVAILIVRSLDRVEKLTSSIALELNKARRMYHLGKNLAEEKRRAWFTDLHGYVYDYHMFFEKNDFSRYEASDPLFRKITYHVYTLPAVDTPKETALYNELLRAAADAVMARQNVHELRRAALPVYVWLVVLLTGVAVTLSVFLVTPESVTAKIVEAALLAALFLGVDLLSELDSLRFFGRREIADRYVANIARLELRNREQEV